VNGAFGFTDIGVPPAKPDPLYKPRPFAIKQFHFHRGSENTIDGLQYALEMHIVHATDHGDLAVLCIFFKQGNEDNAWLNQLGWKTNLPPPARLSPIPGQVDLLQALPASLNYVTFPGSLTTPPCTEGVMFFALLQPVPISADQVGLLPYRDRLGISQHSLEYPNVPSHLRICAAVGRSRKRSLQLGWCISLFVFCFRFVGRWPDSRISTTTVRHSRFTIVWSTRWACRCPRTRMPGATLRTTGLQRGPR
jgi:hypothetical protein